MNIRTLTADDAAIYRDLRIQALTLNPESFLTTYDDYIARPLEQTATQLAPADCSFTLGAYVDDCQLVGTATLIRERAAKIKHIASVQAMFVASEFRRKGTGRKAVRSGGAFRCVASRSCSSCDSTFHFVGLRQFVLSVPV